MVTAKCQKCLGSGEGKTFSEASQNINHAIGLSRGIKCGANYNKVIQIGEDPKPKTKKSTIKKTTPKPVEKSATPKPIEEKLTIPISEDTKE